MRRSACSLPAAAWGVPAWARWIILIVAAGALLTILGPFGSYLNGGALRLLAHWIGAMLLGLVLYGSAYRLIGIGTATGSGAWWLALIVATLLASGPEAWATRAAAFRLWPELAKVHLPLPLWFAQTTTIGLIAMTGVGAALRRSLPGSVEAPAVPRPSRRSRP